MGPGFFPAGRLPGARQRVSGTLSFANVKTGYNDTSAHLRSIDVRLTFPIGAFAGGRFTGTGNFFNDHFSQFPTLYGSTVTAVSGGLTWSKSVGRGKFLVLSGDLGVYSDFVSLTGSAIREKLGFSYFKVYSLKWALGLGVEYRNQFYGNQVIPIVAVLYNSNLSSGHWRLSGILPYNPRLSYVFDKNSAISLEFKQSYNSYQLTDSTNRGDYLKAQRTTALVNYEYTFSEHWRLTAGVGAARQKYQVFNSVDDHQWWLINTPLGQSDTPLETVSKGGPQLNIGLVFNPRF
jgi:hypothetical protein